MEHLMVLPDMHKGPNIAGGRLPVDGKESAGLWACSGATEMSIMASRVSPGAAAPIEPACMGLGVASAPDCSPSAPKRAEAAATVLRS